MFYIVDYIYYGLQTKGLQVDLGKRQVLFWNRCFSVRQHHSVAVK